MYGSLVFNLEEDQLFLLFGLKYI